ncbi:MAG: universal stress protein [Acidobacteria bacterium]|nr:universal stress protein [Acidobacteriota bacterium]
MFTSILCPVDFSTHSERALSLAMDLAAQTGAHLTILTVVDPLLAQAAQAAGRGNAVTAQTQDALQSLLGRVTKVRGRLPEAPGISVAVGDAAQEILKQSADCRADLIVMGTQGLEGPRRFVFGSTTERVLRESLVPVLAVPAPPDSTS